MLERVRGFLVTVFFFVARVLRQPTYTLRRCSVSFRSRIERGGTLVQTSVGPYTYLGAGVFMHSVTVGNYCSVASGVKVGGMEHSWWWGSTSPRISRQNLSGQPTVIEDDVWLGANVVVRQGVRIGRGAVVGAGSVVLKDVSAYTIVAGVPSREIRKRFSVETIEQVLATRYWEFPPARAKELLDAIVFRPSGDASEPHLDRAPSVAA